MEIFLDLELSLTFPGLSLDYEGFVETITHWCSPKLASENKANVTAAKWVSYVNSLTQANSRETKLLT